MLDDEEIKQLVERLVREKAPIAYKSFLELEKLAGESNILYPYTDDFARMVTDLNYGNRVFGFRLFCKQAKWDVDFKIDENIDSALEILEDAKPTAVRQALAALKGVAKYKPDLRETISSKSKNINVYKYKDTMHSLLKKDISELLKVCDK